jgi:hypothetical protein
MSENSSTCFTAEASRVYEVMLRNREPFSSLLHPLNNTEQCCEDGFLDQTGGRNGVVLRGG